jgi:hypothetical protein
MFFLKSGWQNLSHALDVDSYCLLFFFFFGDIEVKEEPNTKYWEGKTLRLAALGVRSKTLKT